MIADIRPMRQPTRAVRDWAIMRAHAKQIRRSPSVQAAQAAEGAHARAHGVRLQPLAVLSHTINIPLSAREAVPPLALFDAEAFCTPPSRAQTSNSIIARAGRASSVELGDQCRRSE